VVRDFHEAGLFHGQLNLSNILLDFTGGSSVKCCSAVLIDYSKLIIVSESSFGILDEKHRNAYVNARNQKDLKDLGMIIYVVLSNCIVDSQPSQEEDTARSGEDEDVQRSKRGKSQAVQQRNNLPLYLVSLALSLLTPVTDQAGNAKFVYKSAREVLSDLQLAASDPDVYLKFHQWEDFMNTPLMMPQGSFFGQKTELSMVQHAFDAMMEGGNKTCAITVSGYAGAG
jgi:hypothetical protein